MTTFRYTDFAKEHLDVKSFTSVNVLAVCPFHDDSTPSLSFHLDRGLFHCWACKTKGSISRIAKQVGLEVRDNGFVVSLDNPDEDLRVFARELGDLSNPPVHESASLPETWLTRFTKSHTDYWGNRGLLPRTIEHWQLGYDRMANHATLPLRDLNGGLLGVIRRQLDEGAKPRYLNPRGYQKRSSFFGAWMRHPAPRSKATVLVEGPLDVLKVYQAGYNALGILGGEFTSEQVTVLHKLGVESVVSFFDADTAGLRIGESMYWHCKDDFEIKAAMYQLRDPDDPGAMSTTQIRRAITNGVPLRAY